MPPPRHDDVDMGVVGQRRAPAVEHSGQSDPGAEMLGIGGNGDERFRRCLEQHAVDSGLVLVGDVGDQRWQGEHDVIVRDRQQLGLAFGQPFFGGHGLALRTMAVAARIVSDPQVGAIFASLDMAAERRRPAGLDGRHDFQLAEAHMAGVGAAPGRAVAAEDIRHLDPRTGHDTPSQAGDGFTSGTGRRSSGLMISPIALRATRV